MRGGKKRKERGRERRDREEEQRVTISAEDGSFGSTHGALLLPWAVSLPRLTQ